MKALQRFLCNEEGATAVEYCVVLGCIIIVCIVGIGAVGGSSDGLWNKNSSQLTKAMKAM